MHLFTLRGGNNPAKSCMLKNMYCLMECASLFEQCIFQKTTHSKEAMRAAAIAPHIPPV